MTRKLKAKPPYTLEMSGADEVTMHFDIHRSPGGAPEKWIRLGVLMIIGGVIPGAMLAGAFSDEFSGFMFFVGWIGSVILPFIFAKRAYKKQAARGSQYTRIIFTHDELETTGKQRLDRSGIEGSWWISADTTFTYTDSFSYEFNKGVADSKAEKGHAVGVTYGADEVTITHHTLKRKQAQKIADAVARWLNDPQHLFEEAAATTPQAEAA